jgi:hypothetical protein
MDSFRYSPLDTTKQQMRLVQLHRAAAHEHTHVFCDIHTFEVATAPPYIALSYTWGAPDPKRIIFVGDEPHEVRENLCDFLFAFRTEDANSNYIYVDQLCIDQDSADERNHQMRLMSKIYSHCIAVLVWLDQTSAKAARDFHRAPQLESAELILRDRYFTRLWIVQEVLLAPEAIIFCGGVWLSWDALGELIWNMPEWYLSIRRPHDTASMAWLFKSTRGTLWERNRIPFDRCSNLFACMQCEDPRDKVYGLLGLIGDEEQPEIDYRKTVQEVYLNAISVLRSIHWRDHLKKGKVQDEFGRRAAMYKSLEDKMLLRLSTDVYKPFLKAICDAEDLILARSENVPECSPILAMAMSLRVPIARNIDGGMSISGRDLPFGRNITDLLRQGIDMLNLLPQLSPVLVRKSIH